MQDDLLVPVTTPPLSQGMRVVDTFIAPSKTFTDILRSASCWLPIVLMVVLTVGWAYSVNKTVGFAAVTEQQMTKSPKAAERMDSLPPDQRARQVALTTKITGISTYASFVFVLIVVAIEALIFWASLNFGLGAKTKFTQVFAVLMFAGLPRYLIWLLSAVLLFAGVGTDNFDMRNPVGTNIGYYLGDATPWLKTAGSFFDLLGFWSLGLMILGFAIISGKKLSQTAVVVIGWWAIVLLVVTGATAAFS